MSKKNCIRRAFILIGALLLAELLLIPGPVPAQEEVASSVRRYKEHELSTGFYEKYEVRPQICGNLHPFMTGELVVRPNTPYHLFTSLSVWVTF